MQNGDTLTINGQDYLVLDTEAGLVQNVDRGGIELLADVQAGEGF